jgi:hypothetical protein
MNLRPARIKESFCTGRGGTNDRLAKSAHDFRPSAGPATMTSRRLRAAPRFPKCNVS